MRLKVISGIMLTLFVVSLLSTVMSVSATAGWIPEDISGPQDAPDGKVDMFDILVVGLAFGSKPGDPNWDPVADVETTFSLNLIDIFDLVTIAVHFGEFDC